MGIGIVGLSTFGLTAHDALILDQNVSKSDSHSLWSAPSLYS